MITLQNTSHDPFYNQAFEEYVFTQFPEEEVFFLWRNTPSVVVGCYQNICREVSVQALRKQRIPVIRRPSGGGTVYHDLGNVNYTYSTRSKGLVDYDACLQPVIAALNAIGVPAQKGRSCDIWVDGRKISGSAQRMAGGRLLHHGTLLFESDLAVLDQITVHGKNDCFQSGGTQSAICPVTNIREHLRSPMTIAEFQERLLGKMLPSGSKMYFLSQEQEQAVCRLRDEKYPSWEWIWGRTPAFTYEKQGAFADAPIRVRYQAKKGIVSGVEIESSQLDCKRAKSLFDGTRLDPDAFYAICETLAGDRAESLFCCLL